MLSHRQSRKVKDAIRREASAVPRDPDNLQPLAKDMRVPAELTLIRDQ